MVVFVIVNNKCDVIYELDLSENTDELSYLHQFILHASLDMLYSSLWSNNATFLKVIDKFNSAVMSAYVTPGGTSFLLLHNGKHEDPVRNFFVDVHEVYAKYILNPFVSFYEPIISPQFDSLVRSSAKRYLN